MSLGTAEDRELAERLSRTCDPEWTHTSETLKAVRRFVMTDHDGEEMTYLAYKLISVNSQPFSRSGMIWEAFRLVQSMGIPMGISGSTRTLTRTGTDPPQRVRVTRG